MTEFSPLHPDAFAAHTASLRRLAESLTRCPSAADDAVQETWLRALRTSSIPPVARVHAWLCTILRNVVTSGHRSATRRRDRESDVTEDGEERSPLDLLERRETLRAVMAAVMELDDELQEVVFLRHFDEEKPREIAARLGLPVATVYRRLKLARQRLRESLADRCGQGERPWQGLVLALFGREPARWSIAIRAAFLMTLNAKILLVVATLAVATVPVLLLGDDPDIAPPVHEHEVTPDDPTRAVASIEEPERRPVDATATDPFTDAAAALEPFEFHLRFTATDQVDLPVGDARILLAPHLHELNAVGQTTGDGVLDVRWRGMTSSMDMVFATQQQPTRLRTVHVRAGETAHVGVRVERSIIVDVHDETGNSFVFAETPQVAKRSFVPADRVDGHTRFVTSSAGREQDGDTIGIGEYTVGAEWALSALSLNAAEPGPTMLEGRIHTGPDDPGSAVHIAAFGPDGEFLETKTGQNGTFRLRVTPGEWTLRAGGGEHGTVTDTVSCSAEATTEWHARLDRGSVLSGRLMREDGTPLAEWYVEASSSTRDGAWFDRARTDADGRFAIPNAPPRAHAIRFFESDEERLGPAWDMTLTPSAGVADVIVPNDSLHRASFRIELSAGDTEELATTTGRLMDVRRGTGIEFSFDGTKAELEALVPGDYRLLLGGTVVAWTEWTRFRADPGQAVDLGVASLPVPARVEWPEGPPPEFARIGPAVVSTLRPIAATSSSPPTLGNLPLISDSIAPVPHPPEISSELTVDPVAWSSTPHLDAVRGILRTEEGYTLEITPSEPEVRITGELAPGRYLVFPASRDEPPFELQLAPGEAARISR